MKVKPAEIMDIALSSGNEIKENSARWRLRQLNSLTHDQILSDLSSVKTNQQILETLLRLKNLGLKQQFMLDKEIAKYKIRIEEKSGNQWDFRNALTWYSLNLRPLSYLEMGMGNSDAFAHVASNFKPVAIYGFETKAARGIDGLAPSPIWISELLRGIGHSGYVRFMLQDSASGPMTFLENYDSFQQFDLIFLNESQDQDWLVNCLKGLLLHLSSGGALIVTHGAEAMSKDGRRLLEANAGETVVLMGLETTLILRAGCIPEDREDMGYLQAAKEGLGNQNSAAYVLRSEGNEEQGRQVGIDGDRSYYDYEGGLGVSPVRINKQSELDSIIPPEIKNDELYYLIDKMAAEEDIKSILEIGSSAGTGSTEAFVSGLQRNPNRPTLFCTEISRPRFAELQKRYAASPFVKCYNVSSVPLNKFPSEDKVAKFYNSTKTALNNYSLSRVLGWLQQDIEYLKGSGVPQDGVQKIKRENKIDNFDMVLIDGSEFSGKAELDEVYGSKIIMLDDIDGYKNYHNYHRMTNDPNYSLIAENRELRNGYAIFKSNDQALPIHFFTIVLNGEPFIRYHIDVFRKLPFRWHWHIVEGVADLKHDTAWSLQFGGRITNELHRDGFSNDGTTEYLDELAEKFPENITIYRKPKGIFWDGKLEMVNAPIADINEECLLWQVDSDELWTRDQLIAARQMFMENSTKSAAYYYCHYFVGENLVTTTRNTYSNNTGYEWLRTWRFKPGMRWMAHEPPRLCKKLSSGKWEDIAKLAPIKHNETEARKLIFQHYAYATEKQLRFKEIYFGYRDAVKQWKLLQGSRQSPIFLRDYFAWVNDGAKVGSVKSLGLIPLARKNEQGEWFFMDSEKAREDGIAYLYPPDFDPYVVTASSVNVHTKTRVRKSARSMKNILVVSHERSGTHFLINTIAKNFPMYSNHELSVIGTPHELRQIFEAYYSIEERRIFKSHHQFYFFGAFFQDLIKHFHVFYIVRDGRDVLNSCFHYYNKHPDIFPFARSNSISEFLTTEPDGGYSLKMSSNVTERWTNHVESWMHVKDQITIVKYEDLCLNLKDTVKHISKVCGIDIGGQVGEPLLQKDRCIDPRKGVVGDWRRSFTGKDLSIFNDVASGCMQRLEYYEGQTSDSESPTNVIWIRTDSIGDNILGDSMLPYIRGKYKDAKITVVCQKHIAEIYKAYPFVDNIIRFERQRAYQDEQYRMDILQQLQAVNADLALNSVYSREPLTDLFTIDAGAKERIAFNGNLCNISAEIRDKYNQFYTRLLPSVGAHKLELERHRDFLKGLGIEAASLQPNIWITSEDDKFADDFFTSNNLQPEKTIALFAGAQFEVRIYPQYGTALSQIYKDSDFSVIALGSEMEYAINQESLDAIGVRTINLCGKTTLRQTAALLKRCRLAVGAETGTAHMACAVATPNVILLGGGHFGRFMPYSASSSIVCLPLECYGCNWQCKHQTTHCIKDIAPEVIAKAVRQTLERRTENPRVFVQGSSLWNQQAGQPKWKTFDAFLNISAVEIIPIGEIPPGIHENWQGEVLFSRGDTTGALETFRRAIEINPNYATAHNNLGVLYWQTGEAQKAVDHFAKALEIDPNDRDTVLNCGNLLKSLGKVEEVRSIYSSYLRKNPNDEEIGRALSELQDKGAIETREVKDEKYLVSAIVSTYNSERFIRHCLEDLEAQTITDKLEIIVVNSGSLQNEEAIIKEFQQRYSNIKYIRTEQRETIYAAWNRGIRAAAGKYITNANTDDRHRKDAFEILAKILDENPDAALVYADQIITEKENETLEKHTPVGVFFWPDFDRNYLLKGCSIGPQPMWQKSVHEEFGYFDESMQVAGDYEFWLRITQKYPLKHVPELLGLYYRSSQNAEYRNHRRTMQETALVQYYYKSKLRLNEPQIEGNPLVSVILPTYNRPHQLETALKSVALQSYKNIEAVVVNDGGKDVSAVIAKFKDQLEIQYINHKQNKDCSAARNTGLKNARGEYIAYLDDDDIFHTDHIEALLRVLTNSDYKIVYSDAFRAHQRKIDGNYLTVRKDIPYSIDYQPGMFLKTNITPILCIIHEKSVIDEIGYFDESLPVLEDWDLWIRISQKYEFYHIKKATCEFTWRDDGSTTTSAKIDQFAKYRHIIAERYLKKASPQKEKDQRPLVSIIMLTFNALQYTKKCIESIFKHTKEPFELIVVDNGSTDGTVEYLESEVGSRKSGGRSQKTEDGRRRSEVGGQKSEVRIKIIKNKEHLGFAVGNNQGMAMAKGDYVLLMNNDLVVTPGWLTRMMACAERKPQIGIVGPVSNYVSGPQLVKEVSYDTTSLARLNEFSRAIAKKHAGQSKPFWRVVGFCMLIKRAVIEKIGGLDGRYGLGNFEDDDFSLRAALAGFESRIAQDCFVHHFGNRTFIGANIKYRDSLHQNWEIFKEKWGLPKELSYDPFYYNVIQISKGGFVPEKHYCPINGKNPQRKNNCGNTNFAPDAAEKKYIREIQPLIKERKHEKAIMALEELIESYPKFALAHNDLGVLYYKQGDKERALIHYEKSGELEPEQITFQKNLADFYCTEMGRVEDALRIYNKVLESEPEDVETLFAIGYICECLQQFKDAKVFYERILEIEPWNENVRKNLNRLFTKELSGIPEQESFDMSKECKKQSVSVCDVNQYIKPLIDKSECEDTEFAATIIIKCTGKQKELNKCLKSIKNNTFVNYNIIYINTGATKGAIKLIKRLIKEDSGGKHRLIEKKDNSSIVDCYNEVLKTASCEYVILMHDDVLVPENWLSDMIECINIDPEIGIVGPVSNNADGAQKDINSGYPSIEDFLNYAKSFRKINRHRRIPAKNLSGFCVMLKRELIKKVGLLDEKFNTETFLFQDYCLRANISGYQSTIAGDVYLHHNKDCKSMESGFNNQGILRCDKRIFHEKWSGLDAKDPTGKGLIAFNTLAKAEEFNHKGQVEKAVDALLEGIGSSPDDRKLYITAAKILAGAKQFQDALETLDEMSQVEGVMDNTPSGIREETELLVLKSLCMEGLGRYDEAHKYAERTLLLDPDSASALNLKGILAYKQGDSLEAEKFFNMAVNLDPSYGEPYTNLGTMKWEAGDEKVALDLYEKGFILSPAVFDIATLYHRAITSKGKYHRCEKQLRDAASILPNNKKISYMLIDILIKQEKYQEAMEEIESAIVKFGIDDGILTAAIRVRDILGPKEISESSKKDKKVSLCMIVKNEEKYLAKCLKSIKPVVDEMIVVDTGSTDRTKDLARVFGAKVFDYEWINDFSDARNYSIGKASGGWIFVLDADEVISSKDYEDFRKLIAGNSSKLAAYLVTTRNYTNKSNVIGWMINCGEYPAEESGTGWVPTIKARLFHNDTRIRFDYPVHEMLDPSLLREKVKVEKCGIPVHHYGKLDEKNCAEKGNKYYQMGIAKLKEMGDSEIALRELAVQAGILGKYDDAIDLWQRFLDLGPAKFVGDAYVNMATAFGKLGKYEDASGAAKKAMELFPDMKEAPYSYAFAELFRENAEEIISFLENLTIRFPEYPPARFLMVMAYICSGMKKKGMDGLEKLKQTLSKPVVAVACHEFARGLVKAHKIKYALLILEAVIASDITNRDILSLFSRCLEKREHKFMDRKAA